VIAFENPLLKEANASISLYAELGEQPESWLEVRHGYIKMRG
jgi:hypothetical protein